MASVEDSKSDADFLEKLRFTKTTKKHEINTEQDDNSAPPPYADCYKMNHSKRGIAIIFNHVEFSMPECPRRSGSDKDRDDLVNVFHELDFDVLVHNDLTANEVVSNLVTVSQMDHSNSDCLVVVAMSHGDSDKIYARDRDYPTRRLWTYFNARNCPSLAGKPKLFFVQACRGQGLDPSQTLHYKTNGIEEDSFNNDACYTIPVMADFLIMYSTIEGFISWRDPEKGGYFIQSLVKQLRLHSKNKDLLTILTFVNREVAVDFTSYEPSIPKYSGCKQMCSIVSMLTRTVYFNDKKCLNK